VIEAHVDRHVSPYENSHTRTSIPWDSALFLLEIMSGFEVSIDKCSCFCKMAVTYSDVIPGISTLYVCYAGVFPSYIFLSVFLNHEFLSPFFYVFVLGRCSIVLEC
jgi:hypothetical protein